MLRLKYSKQIHPRAVGSRILKASWTNFWLRVPAYRFYDCNIGYCFINFRTMESARDFANKSRQVCVVSAAAFQGSKATMAKLSPSILPPLIERPKWQPVLFDFNQTRDVTMASTCQPARNDFGDCTFFSQLSKSPDTPPKVEEKESDLHEIKIKWKWIYRDATRRIHSRRRSRPVTNGVLRAFPMDVNLFFFPGF